MTELVAVPKRIGGSLAVFLPAEVVRRERIREGVPIRVVVERRAKPQVLGLLKGVVPYEPFSRRKERWYPDE